MGRKVRAVKLTIPHDDDAMALEALAAIHEAKGDTKTLLAGALTLILSVSAVSSVEPFAVLEHIRHSSPSRDDQLELITLIRQQLLQNPLPA